MSSITNLCIAAFCVGWLAVLVKSANVADADGVGVVGPSASAGRVAVGAVHGQRPSHLYGAVQVNHEVVPYHLESALFVPFVNVGSAYILPGPGG